MFQSDPDALVTQSLEWRDAVMAGGHFIDESRLYELPDGQQIIVPLARPRWQPRRAAYVSSWPRRWSVGGPVSRYGRIDPAHASFVLADVARLGALGSQIFLPYTAHANWLHAAGPSRVEEMSYFVVDLSGGFAEIWAHRFRSSARNCIRRAERSHLDVEVDRTGKLLGTYRDLFERTLSARAAKQGVPMWLARRRFRQVNPVSHEQLTAVARAFRERCVVWVARERGNPIAALIVLHAGSRALAWRSAKVHRPGTPVYATELLHRLAIEDACEKQLRFYDNTHATPGSPLATLKQKLGATMHPTRILTLDRPPLATMKEARGLPARLVRRAVGRSSR